MYNGKTVLDDESAALILAAIVLENKGELKISERSIIMATQKVSSVWAKSSQNGEVREVELGVARNS